MSDTYIAITYIYGKLSDGTYSKNWSKFFDLRDNDIQKLKDNISNLVISKTAGLDCCVNILYEKNGEYYDSEEIFLKNGVIA